MPDEMGLGSWIGRVIGSFRKRDIAVSPTKMDMFNAQIDVLGLRTAYGWDAWAVSSLYILTGILIVLLVLDHVIYRYNENEKQKRKQQQSGLHYKHDNNLSSNGVNNDEDKQLEVHHEQKFK